MTVTGGFDTMEPARKLRVIVPPASRQGIVALLERHGLKIVAGPAAAGPGARA